MCHPLLSNYVLLAEDSFIITSQQIKEQLSQFAGKYTGVLFTVSPLNSHWEFSALHLDEIIAVAGDQMVSGYLPERTILTNS